MVDYSKFSTEDLINLKNGDYSKVSTEGLLLLKENQQPQENKKINPFSLEDVNKKIKEQANENLEKRAEWEQKHPVISRFQADYQPFYRGDKTKWELQSKYGGQAPLKESIKSSTKELLQNTIPYVNVARDTALTAITKGKEGFLPRLGKEIGIGALQGATAEAIDELSNNGISKNVLDRAIKGAEVGGLTAGAVGSIAPTSKFLAQKTSGLKPNVYEQLIKPESKALDLDDDAARMLRLDTTERLRTAYDKLKRQKANNVALEANKLTQLNAPEYQTNVSDIKNIISSVFDEGAKGRVNPLRINEGNTEKALYDILNEIQPNETNSLNPEELLGFKRTVGDRINWDNSDIRNSNQILSKVYSRLNNRLNEISPSLRSANNEFSQLQNLLDEKSRLRTILNPKSDIETATSKLSNYKSTNKNIYDLENQLVNELGEKPFLSEIDDANAAINLLESIQTGVNPLGTRDILKGVLIPELKLMRGINRRFPNAQNVATPTRQIVLNPLAREFTMPIFQENKNYNNYESSLYDRLAQ